MTRTQLRQLTRLVTKAAAGLIPFDADPEAKDHHGGRLANASETLGEALAALEQAGLMASRLRAEAGAPAAPMGPVHDAGVDAAYDGLIEACMQAIQRIAKRQGPPHPGKESPWPSCGAGADEERLSSMRPKMKKTHNLPTFDSIGSCASTTGIPLAVLKRAKRSGCPAFRNSRVELGPLLAWLFKRGHDVTEDWSGRLLAAQAKLEELELAERERSLVPMATARKVINDVLGPLKVEMLSAPATMAARCNPGDPEMARIALDDWVRSVLNAAADAMSRPAPQPEP